ncbi:hypothetical protein ABID19_006200 [Mesorhizobium robiniae]
MNQSTNACLGPSLPAYPHQKPVCVKRGAPGCRARFVLELAGLASHKGTGFGNAEQEDGRKLMPTLFRFVVTLTILAGIVYGAMFALAMFVEPRKAEMSVRIPPEKLNPKKN